MNGTRLDGTWNASTPAQPGPAGDVLSLIGEVERHLERIRQAQEAGAARAAAAEERFRTLERRESEVAERTEAIESARTLILGRERELAAEREMLTAMRDELSSRESTLRERALALRGEAERVERESAAARALADEADARCRTLIVERDTLVAERDVARSETERLRHDLAASNERSGRLESRLTELESRGRALDSALVAKDAELAMSRQALESAVAKLTTLAAAVASYAPEVERVAAACPPGSTVPNVDLEPLRSRIAELESLLESARTERMGVESRMNPLHDRVAELESMLAAARSDRTDSESQVHPLRERVADLESELARANLALEMARSAAASAPVQEGTHEPADTAVQREFALRLEEKGRRIAELAGFLRTRKQRLDRLHAMLKARGGSSATSTAAVAPIGGSAARIAEETRLSDFRERLQAAAERLAEAEERMVHRYAHARAPIVAAWAVIALASLASLAWATAGAFFPSPSVASCDLVAAVPAGGSLDPSQMAPWDSMCRSLVSDPATFAALRDRFAERGLGDVPADSWMAGVRMDSTSPGVLRLTAAAATEASAIAALDTLASAVASASRTAPASVEGLPKVEIAGASTQPGQVTFSTARPVSDTGARIVRAAAIFSGLVAAGFAIGFLVHRSIVRSRRLLDDESIVA